MEKKPLFVVILVILSIIVILFLIRLINPREIDDVTPGIPCEKDLMNKADVMWVIPKFDNVSIAEDKVWCEKILIMKKTLGMHGVKHEYKEFGIDRSQEYLDEGMKIFEQCFGFAPEMFKPPQLEISNNNKKLIKNNNLKLKTIFNQITNKVYHCNDSDIIKNKFIDWF